MLGKPWRIRRESDGITRGKTAKNPRDKPAKKSLKPPETYESRGNLQDQEEPATTNLQRSHTEPANPLKISKTSLKTCKIPHKIQTRT
jgi:hypothetical protein